MTIAVNSTTREYKRVITFFGFLPIGLWLSAFSTARTERGGNGDSKLLRGNRSVPSHTTLLRALFMRNFTTRGDERDSQSRATPTDIPPCQP